MYDPSKINCVHKLDKQGKPAGGYATVKLNENDPPVLFAKFQEGPIKEAGGRNGAFVEDLLEIAVQRLEFYNNSGFDCCENFDAIEYINKALGALISRTKRRTAAGTEGTHQGK